MPSGVVPNDSAKHAIEGVRVLFPYLSFTERIEWCERLQPALGVEDWWDVAPYIVNDDIKLSVLGATTEQEELLDTL